MASRLLTSLWLVAMLAGHLRGAIPADVTMHLNGVATGVVASATIETGIAGQYLFVRMNTGGSSETIAPRHFVVAANSTNVLPVTIGGTNYGSPTNMLFMDMDGSTTTNVASDFGIFWGSPFSETYPVGNCLMFGLVRYDLTNALNDPNHNLDTFMGNNSGTAYVVMQSRNRLNDIAIFAHREGVQNGEISNSRGKWYLYQAFYDFTNELFKVRYKDPDNGLITIGDVSCTLASSPAPSFSMHFRPGYLYNWTAGRVFWKQPSARFGATDFLTDEELGITASPGGAAKMEHAGNLRHSGNVQFK